MMAGGAEAYFSAYGLFLKATTAQIGFLSSLPPLIGSFAQLFSARLARGLARRRPLYLAGAIVQTLSFIPLVALPLLMPAHALPLLIACVTLYYAGAHFASPPWTSLMGDLVPERRRGRFFGTRTRYVTITMFIAMLVAGAVLHGFDTGHNALFGFLTIFSVATLARAVSVYHLARMHEPPKQASASFPALDWHGLVARLRASSFARFSLFYGLMQGATAIASPFFTVYMLRDLQFSYLEFTVLMATAVLVQFLALGTWGRLCDAFGNRAILRVTGTMIPIVPLLWLPTSNFWYLLLVQLMGGLAWSGFSLAANNSLYDLVPAARRTSYLALHTVAASVAIFAGAMLGGTLGTILPKDFIVLGHDIALPSALLFVILISGCARGLVAAIFLPRLREVRNVRELPVGRLVLNVVQIVPLSGLIFDIVAGRRGKRLSRSTE